MTKSGKTLRELMLEYANNRQSFRRAKNKTQFLAHWVEISELLAEGWTMTSVCEVLKVNGRLDLHYSSFRRYVAEQLKADAKVVNDSTPGKEVAIQNSTSVMKREIKPDVKKSVPVEKPPYTTPPQFGNLNNYEHKVT